MSHLPGLAPKVARHVTEAATIQTGPEVFQSGQDQAESQGEYGWKARNLHDTG
jgi:hypothetical protein